LFNFALVLAAVYSSKYSKAEYPQCVNSHIVSCCPDFLWQRASCNIQRHTLQLCARFWRH